MRIAARSPFILRESHQLDDEHAALAREVTISAPHAHHLGTLMDFIRENLIDPVSNILWSYMLIYVLLGVGLYFGIRTRFVQVRMFGRMLR